MIPKVKYSMGMLLAKPVMPQPTDSSKPAINIRARVSILSCTLPHKKPETMLISRKME